MNEASQAIGANHPPRDITVTFTPELATFLLANCESNMIMGLGMLENRKAGYSQETTVRIVEMIEQFKAVKAAVKKGME